MLFYESVVVRLARLQLLLEQVVSFFPRAQIVFEAPFHFPVVVLEFKVISQKSRVIIKELIVAFLLLLESGLVSNPGFLARGLVSDPGFLARLQLASALADVDLQRDVLALEQA